MSPSVGTRHGSGWTLKCACGGKELADAIADVCDANLHAISVNALKGAKRAVKLAIEAVDSVVDVVWQHTFYTRCLAA